LVRRGRSSRVPEMVGTRSCGDSKKRGASRRGQAEEPISLNAPPPTYNFADTFSGNGASTVALNVTGHWNPPPTIGEIEAVLMSKGRAQHRINRIEVRGDCAIVEVHPDDVPNCLGLLELGDLQLNVSVAGMGVGVGSSMGLGSFGMDQPPMSSLGSSLGMDTGVDLSSVPPPPPPPPPLLVSATKKRAKVEIPFMEVAPPPSADEVMHDSEELDPIGLSVSIPDIKRDSSFDSLPLSAAAKERLREEEKQRRVYRVGLSYRCGRCGKPKKGHVCDIPDGEEGSLAPFGDGVNLSPQPAILATTVRKGTPPALLGSPLVASPHQRVAMEASPQATTDVKINGEASTIFKDMVAALGENTCSSILSPNGAPTVATPGAPPQMVTAVAPGVSPLVVSAVAAGSVSSAAAPATVIAAASSTAGEPQLSDMDMMLADLAFAARPPPVMTPDEGGSEAVANGLGSLSPSNFSPGTMIQQLIATPGASSWANAGAGLDAAMLGGMPPQLASVRRATVVAQPTA